MTVASEKQVTSTLEGLTNGKGVLSQGKNNFFTEDEEESRVIAGVSLACLVKETLERTIGDSKEIHIFYEDGQKDTAETLKYFLEYYKKRTRLFRVEGEFDGVGINYLPSVKEGNPYYICLPHMNVVSNIFPQRVFSQSLLFSQGLL